MAGPGAEESAVLIIAAIWLVEVHFRSIYELNDVCSRENGSGEHGMEVEDRDRAVMIDRGRGVIVDAVGVAVIVPGTGSIEWGQMERRNAGKIGWGQVSLDASIRK